MTTLIKPLIFDSTGWVEVNWVNQIIQDIEIPAVPATPDILDENGEVLVQGTPEIPARVETVIVGESPLKCVYYHPTQLDLLKADAKALGTSLEPFMEELNDWVLSYVPEEIVKTPEELLQEAKAARQNLVDNIVVVTQSGKSFDGDEASQGRIARAIVALQAMNQPSTQWVLSDNTIVDVPVAELVEALALSGQEQTRLWMAPYQE